MMEYVLLNNNVKMPKLGYGVFQVSNEECERCVLDAISVGYRAIDTAQSYGNEEAVGNAIQKCGVPREELFLTSKIWMSNASYEKAKASIDKSLHKLKTDYLDLMLIHQPFGDYYGAYRAMEEAYKEGKLRAIGGVQLLPGPTDRSVSVRRNCTHGQSGGNPCVSATANCARIHEKVRCAARGMGPLCRREEKLFYQPCTN